MKPYQDFPGPVINFSSDLSNLEGRLRDANILITGGASGLGKACATAFLERGAYVTIADLDTPVLKSASKELQAIAGSRFQAVACNVTDWAAQLELFASAASLAPKGVIDVVIPFAGPRGTHVNFNAPDLTPQPHGSRRQNPPPPTTACVEVALIGMTYTCQLAVWYMAHKRESLRCLIVIGSMTVYRGIAGSYDYSAAKFGARGIFKSLRDAPANLGTSF